MPNPELTPDALGFIRPSNLGLAVARRGAREEATMLTRARMGTGQLGPGPENILNPFRVQVTARAVDLFLAEANYTVSAEDYNRRRLQLVPSTRSFAHRLRTKLAVPPEDAQAGGEQLEQAIRVTFEAGSLYRLPVDVPKLIATVPDALQLAESFYKTPPTEDHVAEIYLSDIPYNVEGLTLFEELLRRHYKDPISMEIDGRRRINELTDERYAHYKAITQGRATIDDASRVNVTTRDRRAAERLRNVRKELVKERADRLWP